MTQTDYLNWVAKNTATSWWHDSANPQELEFALAHGAAGVTTNPVLSYRSLSSNIGLWEKELTAVLAREQDPRCRAENLMQIVITKLAGTLKPQFGASKESSGYICAQVNPAQLADREGMLEMARRFDAWAPNIAVKLPVTAAGLDVLEECAAEGITITATVSFTVPQVIAIAERYRKGLQRAKKKRRKTGKCFAVIMIGRLDDYLRDAALDQQVEVEESDIIQAGLAVTKRAYNIYRDEGFEAVLLVAALRGTYHMSELVGANLVMSIVPAYQHLLLSQNIPREERIGIAIPERTIDKLMKIPEFVRAFEPDGMLPKEFITFGATQRTATQFYEGGWKNLETFRLPSTG
jgi:transaldolase